MRGGDLSNAVTGRFIFVFEGLIGRPPAKGQRLYTMARKAGRWKRAVGYWEIDPAVSVHLWDLAWRWDMRMDVVTFQPEPFAEALRERLDRENLPVSNVFATTPSELSRMMARMPDVVRVFDADPVRAVTAWGNRGVWVEDTSTFQPMAS